MATASDQRALTHGEQRYEWPSTADDGTLVASDELGRLHRIARDGTALGPPIPTAATVATEDVPAETPTHVRLSPDGARIAYAQLIDGDPTTLWTPATATDLNFPGQALGQQGFIAPSWIGNDRLVLSRDVTSDAPSASRCTPSGAATTARSRGSTTPRAPGPPAMRPWPRATGRGSRCSKTTRLTTKASRPVWCCACSPRPVRGRRRPSGASSRLEAADTFALASPTFSPDGTRIAWAESDGIHAATLGTLEDCGAIREQVLTLPGAWEPHWSAAPAPPSPPAGAGREAEALARRQHPPAPAASGAAPPRPAARVTISAPATVRLSVRVAGKKKRFAGVITRKLENAGTTTVRVRMRAGAVKSAKKLVLRASAPGATPVEVTLRPR